MAEMTTPEFVVAEAEKAFKQELDAVSHLTTKAEKYLTAAGVILALKILNTLGAPSAMKDTLRASFHVSAVALLLVSMAVSLLSIRVRRYATYPERRELYDELINLPLDDARLKAARFYLDARATNREANSERAKALVWAGALLLAGFAALVILYLTA
jgi:hypothetical protein